ncbi:hypothetical protein [Parageobacillus toebii]|uniref:hypothetical protein n=1 Tax=Parageobacillus toebii TaxID=153151 RepID=UPI002E21F377|nr:hypothetical protein [Parageobacillus toebii]
MFILIDKNGTLQRSKVIATFHSSVPLPDNILQNEVIELPNYEQPPFVDVPMGKEAVLYVNLETNELFYEFEDRPLTPEEKLKQLEEQQKLIQQALDELLLGGMQ